MKGKQLLILIAVAVVLGGLAIFTARDRAANNPSRTGETLLADLDLNQVTQVDITSAGTTTTFTQVDKQWILPTKFGYPADFDKFRNAMLQLSELKIGSLLELTEAQKQSLQLTPADATVVTLKAADGTALAALMLGATRDQKGVLANSPYGNLPAGRFVSIDGGATAVLISESLQDLGSNPIDWFDADLTSVPGPALSRLSVAGPDQATIEMSRDEQSGELTLTNLAEGETFDPAKRYTIESALSYLSFNDIADPALTDAELGMDNPITFEARTQDGELYIARIGGSPAGSTDRFARFSVAYVGQDDGAAATETTDDEATVEPAATDTAKVRAAALALNQRLANWTYIIPAYKAEALTQSRTDLLKQPEEGTPSTAAETTPSTAPATQPPIQPSSHPLLSPVESDAPISPSNHPTIQPSTPPLPSAPIPQPEEKGAPTPSSKRSGDHAVGPAKAGTL